VSVTTAYLGWKKRGQVWVTTRTCPGKLGFSFIASANGDLLGTVEDNGHESGTILLKVRVLPGSPKRTHPKPLQVGVEQFLEMLRFDQRIKLEELPGIRK